MLSTLARLMTELMLFLFSSWRSSVNLGDMCRVVQHTPGGYQLISECGLING
jgi:hypothetical protein